MSTRSVIAAVSTAAALALTGCSASGPDEGSATQPAALELVAAATAVPTTTGVATTDNTSITTVGTGKVKGTPDVMTIGLGVETRATSATAALEQNNALAAEVIQTLKDSGVDPADLQTSQLSVNPTYDDKYVINGYQVTNSVTAKLRDIGAAGAVIDAVAQKAGDAARVQQISFAIDDDSALRAAARADAVHQAQAQAKQLADAAGVQLGAIRSITESTSIGAPQFYDVAMTQAAAGVPLEAGSQELSVVVQIVYDVVQ